MKFTTLALGASTARRLSEQSKILNHIKKYPSKEGELARAAYIRTNIITILIIIFVLFPMVMITMHSMFNNEIAYPEGATKQIGGRISLYEDTFWYTDDSKRYEFDFKDYAIDNSYEPGEKIWIYLDDNSNIVAVSHRKENNGQLINLILMIIVPIALLLVHAFLGRKMYSKWWYLYTKWYEKEIEPYCYQENFEEIIANKKFYDVTININDLSIDEQKLYKKYRNKGIVYGILLLICVALTIYVCTKFNINSNNWIIIGVTIVYLIIFYVLIDNCSVEMNRIKSGYYKNK